MGYWSYLVVDCGGASLATVKDFNGQTHNTHVLIFQAIGRCFSDFHGWTASDMIPPLRLGISRIEQDEESFRKYEPDNKWGTVESSLSYMKEVLSACIDYPNAKYEYSG